MTIPYFDLHRGHDVKIGRCSYSGKYYDSVIHENDDGSIVYITSIEGTIFIPKIAHSIENAGSKSNRWLRDIIGVPCQLDW